MKVEGSRFEVLEFRFWSQVFGGLGVRISVLGCMVWGSGCRFSLLGARVEVFTDTRTTSFTHIPKVDVGSERRVQGAVGFGVRFLA